MIPDYDAILSAIAAHFKVSTVIAERWILYHVGQNMIDASSNPEPETPGHYTDE